MASTTDCYSASVEFHTVCCVEPSGRRRFQLCRNAPPMIRVAGPRLAIRDANGRPGGEARGRLQELRKVVLTSFAVLLLSSPACFSQF